MWNILLQVVLEVLESNVKRGSQVYEEGHVSVQCGAEMRLKYVHFTRREAGL